MAMEGSRMVINLRQCFSSGLLLLCIANWCAAKTWQINSAQQLKQVCKQVAPGDEIVWADGSYADQDIKFVPVNKGEKDKPITLRAQTPGKVILTGTSRIHIEGEHLVVDGFDFNGGSIPSDWVIRFERGSRHCRLTQTRIHDKNGDGHKAKWVYIHGRFHEIDHCTFTHKVVEDNLLTVWLDDAKDDQDGKGVGHLIHDNYFANRPLGTDSNGWEIMRIGDSKTSMMAAHVRVYRNLFEKCDGEIEIISNKSCFNTYENNTFLHCKGQMTLRHGNNCIVRDNVFLGEGHELNSGVRVIGEGHIVEGNYMENLNGELFYGAIVLNNAFDDGPIHGYWPVKNGVIRNNILINCRSPFDIGVKPEKAQAFVAPTDTLLEGNTVIDPSGLSVITFRQPIQGELTWKNNRITGMEITQKLVSGNNKPLADDAFTLLKESPAKVREMTLQRLKPLDREDVGAVWAR
jgi:poly(beta-D-mannuronate) lyase